MRALDLKLLRDLWHLRGQALAIALVLTGGVATFVMSRSTLDALHDTRAAFYQETRFADVFASLKRAPESLRERIAAIPGVAAVETRVVTQVNVDLPGFPEPVKGRLVSVPDSGAPLLNDVYLRRGRLIDPARDDEALVSEAFAEAHGLDPGDTLSVVINGRYKRLTLVGVVLSPEVVYQLAPGAVIPDFRRYSVLWMARRPLATANDMDGAFNDVALSIAAGASAQAAIDRLDGLLAPYGGLGAYTREDQVSHRYLNEEFRQLEQMAVMYPVMFLGVAAFLLNVVVSRLVSTQREQIAMLKAFGYGNGAVTLHYVKLILAITLLGDLGGVALGVWMGQGLGDLYMDYYRFPFLLYRLDPALVLVAVLISAAAALSGTLFAVRAAARLRPAEAMRPEAPPVYRATLLERIGLQRLLAPPSRMILRHLERRPFKALLSVVGIALSYAILMLGSFFGDAVDFLVDVQFRQIQREDMTVSFVETTGRGALFELQSLPGVRHAEGVRGVAVRLRNGYRTYRTGLQGLERTGRLQRVLDESLRPIPLPEGGLLLSDYLGELLGAGVGDRVTVEILEGERPVYQVPVARVITQFVGVAAYMDRTALNRLLREGDVITGALLAADRHTRNAIYDELKARPRVAGVEVREYAIDNFNELMAQSINLFSFFVVILAGSIAFGVVYNSARIALAERGRELASLRVLGFTRGEISYILLGEMALLTLAALPVGFLIGQGMAAYMIETMQSELFRIPYVLEARTYAFAALVVLVASALSALIVRRRLDRLDLVAVLKTRE